MISVIIPTRNRSGDLEKVLPSYLSQGHVLEIIVVDDSTQEGHRKKNQGLLQADSRLVLIQDGPPMGLPAARNKGIRRAKGPFIFFGEDDLELAPDHLSRLLHHLKERGAAIIEGRKIWKEPDESNEEALKRAEDFKGPLWDPFYLEFFSARCLPKDTPTPLLLSHFLAKREVFESVLFEEDYEGFRRGFPWHEETDFLMRAAEAGFLIFFCPHVVSFQPFTKGGGIHEHSFWLQEYWVLRNHCFLLRRHRRFIREKLKNPWPWPLLLIAYGCHRFKSQLRSKLYQIKKQFYLSF